MNDDSEKQGNDATKPVQPVRLRETDGFCFSCHHDLACWNTCCHGADLTLTPGDILQLKSALEITAGEFIATYTVPAIWPSAGLPVAKLKMSDADGRGACPFMEEEGCSVYSSRPLTCRYYPLGLGAFTQQQDEEDDAFCFRLDEPHCKGDQEESSQTVGKFLQGQEVGAFESVDAGWMEILAKMASWKSVGGPQGRDVSPQTKQMFYMVSTDTDVFRRFVTDSKFLTIYEISPERIDQANDSDEALLQLGFEWLKNVMFNDPTLTLKTEVLNEAVVTKREDWGAA